MVAEGKIDAVPLAVDKGVGAALREADAVDEPVALGVELVEKLTVGEEVDSAVGESGGETEGVEVEEDVRVELPLGVEEDNMPR